jgi:hypothetical protein
MTGTWPWNAASIRLHMSNMAEMFRKKAQTLFSRCCWRTLLKPHDAQAPPQFWTLGKILEEWEILPCMSSLRSVHKRTEAKLVRHINVHIAGVRSSYLSVVPALDDIANGSNIFSVNCAVQIISRNRFPWYT